jgi:hypothetical protein
MARLLYQRDSSAFMLNAIRRHKRLCQQNPNGGTFITAIQPAETALRNTCKLLEDAEFAREDAYDDVQLADYDLDNTIRDTFDAWKPYVRNHATEHEVNRIFPDGTFSRIVRMPYANEPNEADAMAAKIESLGATHQLYPFAAAIKAKTAPVRTAIDAHKETIRKQKLAEAEVEIAKMDAVRAYEINYLDARKQLGVIAAERLFPQLSVGEKDEDLAKTQNN